MRMTQALMAMSVAGCLSIASGRVEAGNYRPVGSGNQQIQQGEIDLKAEEARTSMPLATKSATGTTTESDKKTAFLFDSCYTVPACNGPVCYPVTRCSSSCTPRPYFPASPYGYGAGYGGNYGYGNVGYGNVGYGGYVSPSLPYAAPAMPAPVSPQYYGAPYGGGLGNPGYAPVNWNAGYAPVTQPVLSQPAYGAPVYTQPAFSQPAYGQPAYNQPTYGQPNFAQPVLGSPFYP